MIIIKRNPRNKKQPFHVVTTGKNNEPLKSSETFKTKASAWKNIIADVKTNYPGCTGINVTDATGKLPLEYHCDVNLGTKEIIADKSGRETS